MKSTALHRELTFGNLSKTLAWRELRVVDGFQNACLSAIDSKLTALRGELTWEERNALLDSTKEKEEQMCHARELKVVNRV